MKVGHQGLLEHTPCSHGLKYGTDVQAPYITERNRFSPNNYIQNMKTMWILSECVINIDLGIGK